MGNPVHAFDMGVTKITPVIFELEGLEFVNTPISPVPELANPIAPLLLVQLKTVLGTLPEKFTADVGKYSQFNWSGI